MDTVNEARSVQVAAPSAVTVTRKPADLARLSVVARRAQAAKANQSSTVATYHY